MEDEEWKFPVVRTALGAVALVADVAKVAAEAAQEGLSTFSSGIKELRSVQKK